MKRILTALILCTTLSMQQASAATLMLGDTHEAALPTSQEIAAEFIPMLSAGLRKTLGDAIAQALDANPALMRPVRLSTDQKTQFAAACNRFILQPTFQHHATRNVAALAFLQENPDDFPEVNHAMLERIKTMLMHMLQAVTATRQAVPHSLKATNPFGVSMVPCSSALPPLDSDYLTRLLEQADAALQSQRGTGMAVGFGAGHRRRNTATAAELAAILAEEDDGTSVAAVALPTTELLLALEDVHTEAPAHTAGGSGMRRRRKRTAEKEVRSCSQKCSSCCLKCRRGTANCLEGCMHGCLRCLTGCMKVLGLGPKEHTD